MGLNFRPVLSVLVDLQTGPRHCCVTWALPQYGSKVHDEKFCLLWDSLQFYDSDL